MRLCIEILRCKIVHRDIEMWVEIVHRDIEMRDRPSRYWDVRSSIKGRSYESWAVIKMTRSEIIHQRSQIILSASSSRNDERSEMQTDKRILGILQTFNLGKASQEETKIRICFDNLVSWQSEKWNVKSKVRLKC